MQQFTTHLEISVRGVVTETTFVKVIQGQVTIPKDASVILSQQGNDIVTSESIVQQPTFFLGQFPGVSYHFMLLRTDSKEEQALIEKLRRDLSWSETKKV